MAKTSCKCKKSEECEECPEWIFTFADLVMLMMGFFVILWVLKPPAGKDVKEQESSEAQRKWEKTVGEIRKSFGYMPDPNSSDPVDLQMLDKTPRGIRKGAESEEPRDSAVGTDHSTTTIRPGKQSAIGGRLGFDPGNATLLPETIRALDQIADKIRGHYNIVLVKGHAALDDLPDGSTPSQRMELSLRRAQAAADYLASRGVQSEILRVVGCSTFEPVKQRAYGADLQAMNRRVEIEVTAELLESRQDHAFAPAAPSVPQAAAPAGPQARNSQAPAIR
ncbi:MAG: motB [Phycisphaerales bacterium]|nr:motB [Phycisphaerales bacterium]MDB5355180.1 motB [Phycisphaerales bacterium]